MGADWGLDWDIEEALVYAVLEPVNMSDSDAKLRVQGEFLGEDGRGVARLDQLEVHVSDLLPGEAAEVIIDHRSPHRERAWAHIAERTGELSSERQVPACPAFGECGGCVWQHLSYAGQLEEKRRRVVQALAGALDSVPVVALPLAAPDTCGYRNKGKYVFGRNEEGLVLGAYKPRSHTVVSTLGCRIVEPAIDEVATEIATLAREAQLPVYEEGKADASGMRYAILRSNAAGSVQVTLVGTSDLSAEGLLALARSLQLHPRVVGVLRCDNDLRSGGLLTDSVTLLVGEATLAESIVGVEVGLGSNSFWQVHRSQAELAYRAIANALPVRPEGRVLELYSGTGGIAFALAASGHRVLGIERNAEAVSTANAAARQGGIAEQVEFRCQDATRLSPGDFAGVSAVVVDPPRKGLGQPGVEQLLAAKPEHIAYLSCGPESLARDLAQLVEGGYELSSLQLFDFMPGTPQVESLALLQRKA
jgi:23S rRNA (uracil1939-C5)-methyltransferase